MNFILQKDLPHAKAGVIFTPEKSNSEYYNTNGAMFLDRLHKSRVELNPEWFWAIEKQVTFTPKNGDNVMSLVTGSWEESIFIGNVDNEDEKAFAVKSKHGVLYYAKEVKPIEEHVCKYCGAKPTQPDSECYKAPKESKDDLDLLFKLKMFELIYKTISEQVTRYELFKTIEQYIKDKKK